MIIDETNYMAGNNAVGAVLLLYYHLAAEGRFSHAETIYIDPAIFDGFRFLEVRVAPEYEVDIDEKLLREAAVIYLLCDVNDMLSEHEDWFRSTPTVQKFVAAHAEGKLSAVPEASEIVSLLKASEEEFSFPRYQEVLARIYETYVHGTFERLSRPGFS